MSKNNFACVLSFPNLGNKNTETKKAVLSTVFQLRRKKINKLKKRNSANAGFACLPKTSLPELKNMRSPACPVTEKLNGRGILTVRR